MVITLMMMGPLIVFAVILQSFLNRLIEEDRKSFHKNRSRQILR